MRRRVPRLAAHKRDCRKSFSIRKSRPAGKSGDASPPAAATVSWSAARILERRLPRLEHLRWMYRLAWAVPGSQVTDKNPAVRLDAWIGLAVTGQPIGLWSPRTGAPEASATGRDRSHRYTLGTYGAGRQGSATAPAVTTGSKKRRSAPPTEPRAGNTPGRVRVRVSHPAAVRPSGSCPPDHGHRGPASPSG